jgi:uncharacterized protein YbjT (DUF2867 family)
MILVTGATGTVGGEVARQLLASGELVRVLVRDPGRASSLERAGAGVVRGDLAKPETLPPVLEGVERAFLISRPSVELETNFVEAASRSGLGHLVKQSAMGADADSPYGMPRAHGQMEKAIETSGIPYTFLRPVFFMQNLLGFGETVAKSRALPLPIKDPAAAINMVDVRDVAAIAVAALTGEGHEGRVYAITGPEVLTFRDVAERISSVLGDRVRFVPLSPKASGRELREAGLAESAPGWLVDYFRELSSEDTALAGRTGVVEEVLGRPPRSLERFVKDHVEAFAG